MKTKLFILSFCLLQNLFLYSEGTKELMPYASDVALLMIDNSVYGNFAVFDSDDEERLYIHIADPDNEQVFIGLSRGYNSMSSPFNSSALLNYYFRIKDPNGNVVYSSTLINSTSANISTWDAARKGPSNITSGGYSNAFVFDPSGNPSGDYWIEFSTSNTVEGNTEIYIPYYDITVATKTVAPTAINGRIYSKRWAMVATPSIPNDTSGTTAPTSSTSYNDPTYGYFWRAFNGKFYVLDPDEGLVTSVNFQNSGFRPYAYNIAFNSSGTSNTGVPTTDRKSISSALSVYPEHYVFLNDPDQSVYPSGTFGAFTINGNLPNIKGCGGGSGYDISVSVTREGLLEILLDMDQTSGAGNYDAGTADRLITYTIEALSGESPPYERTITWDGLDGLGVAISNGAVLDVDFTYSQGQYHLPVYDAEYLTTGITPKPERPTPLVSYTLLLFYDDSNITGGVVETNGCAPPCHTWTDFNHGNANTINTYWFAQQEDISTTLTVLGCPPNADDDEVTVEECSSIVIDVLDGDSDPNGTIDATTVAINTSPSNGSISINGSTGEITYTPNSNFTGFDEFTYTVKDNENEESNAANVRVNVLPCINCVTSRSEFDWANDFDGSSGTGAYNLESVSFPYNKTVDNVNLQMTMSEPLPAGSVLQGFEVTDEWTGRPNACIPNGRAVIWSEDESANGTTPNHQSTFLKIAFSQDVQGLKFAILDLDDGTFDIDGVVIQFYLNGLLVTTDASAYTLGSRVTNSATYTYQGEGTEGDASNSSTEGDIYINLPTSILIDEVWITFGNYKGTSYNASSTHSIGLTGFSWCKIISPEICNDNIDNDGDGLIDCDDPECEDVQSVNNISNE